MNYAHVPLVMWTCQQQSAATQGGLMGPRQMNADLGRTDSISNVTAARASIQSLNQSHRDLLSLIPSPRERALLMDAYDNKLAYVLHYLALD